MAGEVPSKRNMPKTPLDISPEALRAGIETIAKDLRVVRANIANNYVEQTTLDEWDKKVEALSGRLSGLENAFVQMKKVLDAILANQTADKQPGPALAPLVETKREKDTHVHVHIHQKGER